MPQMMLAATYDRYGPPEVLRLTELPIPRPGAREVLVRVHASGLNPKDALLREGAFGRFAGRTFPKRTGFDLAGTVTQLGADVRNLYEGQRVFGLLDGFSGGAAAQYAVVPAKLLTPIPEALDFPEAAALPLVGLTALQALRDRARLQQGQRLLIRGASGGVGSAAIQLAKTMGAHVTTLSSAANLKYCRDLGADDSLDYATFEPDRHARAFDVIFDCYGDIALRASLGMLRPRGRFVTIAPTPFLLLASLVSRVLPGPRLQVVFVRPRRADLETLARLAQNEKLRMPLQAAYPLERIQEAHQAAGARHARGKRVLLIPSAPPLSAAQLAGQPETVRA